MQFEYRCHYCNRILEPNSLAVFEPTTLRTFCIGENALLGCNPARTIPESEIKDSCAAKFFQEMIEYSEKNPYYKKILNRMYFCNIALSSG